MQTDIKLEQSIWANPSNPNIVQIVDQRYLPHQIVIEDLTTVAQAATAIRDMHVRGAPLIGVTAAFGIYLALKNTQPENWEQDLKEATKLLLATRPTAVNLSWAVNEQLKTIATATTLAEKIELAYQNAGKLMADSIDRCKAIGEFGLEKIKALQKETGKSRLNILTHCNAGWLACIQHGTATAPMYEAHRAGLDIHVWVDETRPRNQGARLTAWELGQAGIPHTVITDNAGGHLMQHGMVDMVIVGCDRCSRRGDVANKIGTYLKALAAKDNKVPFYVALPSSSVDWSISDGLKEIPIEQRSGREVSQIVGWDGDKVSEVRLVPEGAQVANYAFDVTPAHLITGLIMERGICAADENAMLELFPEQC